MTPSPTLNVTPGTIFHMDNINALRGMNSSTVDLIAMDPPFNTGRNREAVGGKYSDQWFWVEKIHGPWMEQIRDSNRAIVEVIEAAMHAHSENLGAFLCFLSVRLIECRRVLKDTGSIYLHCDPEASHYIKGVMDAVFGAKNFRSEIVWPRQSGGKNDAVKKPGWVHDYILFYGRSYYADSVMRPLTEKQKDAYNIDDPRWGAVKSDNLTAPAPRSGESGKSWRGLDPTSFGRHWSPPKSGALGEWIEDCVILNYRSMSTHKRLEALDKVGLIHWPKKEGGWPFVKRPLSTSKGTLLTDLWDDIPPLARGAAERTGYPDQKPVALYERIVAASSNPGDLVLDPFCGCGTTLMAARNLDR